MQVSAYTKETTSSGLVPVVVLEGGGGGGGGLERLEPPNPQGHAPRPPRWSALMCALPHTPPATLAPPVIVS